MDIQEPEPEPEPEPEHEPEPEPSEYESGSDDEIERILSNAADTEEEFGEDTQIKKDSVTVEYDLNSFATENDTGFIETNEATGSIHSIQQKNRSSPGLCSCCCACFFCRKRSRTGTFGEANGTFKKSRSAKCVKEKQIRNKSKRGEGCVRCCKKFTAFLFSHIGLCSLVVAYSVLGGFIFMKLEAPSEQGTRDDVAAKRRFRVQRLWNLTVSSNIFSYENWTLKADDILKEFQKDIFKATKEKGWDGQEDKGEVQWSFAGSLLYSITVITTIGYGHIAPKTDYGRLVTIAYALIGIPLTLLCLANLGSFLGDCFRFIYKHICLFVIFLCCPQQAKWSSGRKPRTQKGIKPSEQNDVTLMMDHINYKDQKHEKIRVPILVSLMLIAIYIFGGAALFASWEGWDLLVGSYFCFITLSTVGFGDFVPGAATYSSISNNEKLIICCFYLVFGLSLIAMCFNLMQEEVRAKFTWLGQKFGIIESDR